MKKLLIIIPHLNRGGAERSAAKLSWLLRHEFDIHIVIFFDVNILEPSFSYTGKFTSIGQHPASSFFSKIRNVATRVAFLRKYKQTHDIDIALSYLPTADIPNVLSRRQEKVFISLRSFLSKNNSGKLQRSIIKKMYPKADGVIAQNPRARTDIVDNFGVQLEKTSVIPNFYDAVQILKDAEKPLPEWNNTGKYLKMLQVGRLEPPKGQWHLLRIFKHVLERVPNARLSIVGRGVLKEFLKDYAATLGLKVQDLEGREDKTPDFDNYHVVLIGFCSNPFKYLRATDLFLFTSIYEGFPNALAEAMICGSTILSSNCTAGPKELLAPDIKEDIKNYPLKTNYGVLFPSFDGKIPLADAPLFSEEQLWVDTIKMYAKDKTTFSDMGEKAKQRMKEYDKNEVRQIWINILEE